MINRRAFIALLPLVPMAGAAFAEPAKLPVVASFSILADIAARVGGDRVAVSAIVGPDMDAHVYEPTPADARKVADAKLMVTNGLGFESWAERLMKAAKFSGRAVVASEGVTPLSDHEGHGHDHGGADPHAWQSAANVQSYAVNIQRALSTIDPEGAAVYATNTQAYLDEIKALDAEIRAGFAAIPAQKRKVITSHDAFAYFGKAYDIAFLAPQGKNTASEASAKDVARLIRQIRAEGVKAIFVENMTNRKVIDQIVRETGATIGGTLYSDALSREAPTYVAMMRHNAKALAAAMQ